MLDATNDAAKPMVMLFLHHKLPNEEIMVMAKIIKILGLSAAVTDFLPPKIASLTLTSIESINQSIIPTQHTEQLIGMLKRYSAELADLLQMSWKVNGVARTDAIALVKGIAERSVSIAQYKTVPPGQAEVIPKSYNPTLGQFYSFNSHGCKVRNPRTSALD